MTLDEVFNLLKSTNLPVTYFKWGKKVPALPYLVYYYPSNDDEFADGTNWIDVKQLNVELYTDNKNFELEKKIERIFKDNDLSFMKSESYISDENMYEVLYEMEVIIDGEES